MWDDAIVSCDYEFHVASYKEFTIVTVHDFIYELTNKVV